MAHSPATGPEPHTTAVVPVDGITYRLNRDVDPARVAALYRSVGWEHLAGDLERLRAALRGSTEVVSAWDGDELVGVARVITDGAMFGLILGVAVRPDRQGGRIGSQLVQRLIERAPDLSYHLWTRNRRFAFYERLGFGRDDTAMHRPGRPPTDARRRAT